jgi:hypothetical protein
MCSEVEYIFRFRPRKEQIPFDQQKGLMEIFDDLIELL